MFKVYYSYRSGALSGVVQVDEDVSDKDKFIEVLNKKYTHIEHSLEKINNEDIKNSKYHTDFDKPIGM